MGTLTGRQTNGTNPGPKEPILLYWEGDSHPNRFDNARHGIYTPDALCVRRLIMNRFASFLIATIFPMFLLSMAQPASAGGYGMSDMSGMKESSGSITLLSPKNGQTFKKGTGLKLRYDVHLSPTGNHLHVYVDDQNPIIDRNVEHCPCSLKLPDLAPGMHSIAVKEATANHVLTGVESTVSFSVK
ncbi:MAG TPA: hypothetical protein VNI58_06345 [Mariprofundaceae bacterium]|nr:hypothetical protein [Mariprofundaceae bacterium]